MKFNNKLTKNKNKKAILNDSSEKVVLKGYCLNRNAVFNNENSVPKFKRNINKDLISENEQNLLSLKTVKMKRTAHNNNGIGFANSGTNAADKLKLTAAFDNLVNKDSKKITLKSFGISVVNLFKPSKRIVRNSIEDDENENGIMQQITPVRIKPSFQSKQPIVTNSSDHPLIESTLIASQTKSERKTQPSMGVRAYSIRTQRSLASNNPNNITSVKPVENCQSIIELDHSINPKKRERVNNYGYNNVESKKLFNAVSTSSLINLTQVIASNANNLVTVVPFLDSVEYQNKRVQRSTSFSDISQDHSYLNSTHLSPIKQTNKKSVFKKISFVNIHDSTKIGFFQIDGKSSSSSNFSNKVNVTVNKEAHFVQHYTIKGASSRCNKYSTQV